MLGRLERAEDCAQYSFVKWRSTLRNSLNLLTNGGVTAKLLPLLIAFTVLLWAAHSSAQTLLIEDTVKELEVELRCGDRRIGEVAKYQKFFQPFYNFRNDPRYIYFSKGKIVVLVGVERKCDVRVTSKSGSNLLVRSIFDFPDRSYETPFLNESQITFLKLVKRCEEMEEENAQAILRRLGLEEIDMANFSDTEQRSFCAQFADQFGGLVAISNKSETVFFELSGNDTFVWSEK